MKKYLNGILVDATAEDIAQYNNDQANAPTQLQIKLNNLRDKRNSLLAKTDWTANSDVTMSNAMKTYRQQLRDAPSGLDTVEKVNAYTFPTEVTK
jgi:hypothetical protein